MSRAREIKLREWSRGRRLKIGMEVGGKGMEQKLLCKERIGGMHEVENGEEDNEAGG